MNQSPRLTAVTLTLRCLTRSPPYAAIPLHRQANSVNRFTKFLRLLDLRPPEILLAPECLLTFLLPFILADLQIHPQHADVQATPPIPLRQLFFQIRNFKSYFSF